MATFAFDCEDANKYKTLITQEMLKKAEILLAEDAKSALEIDQRLMVLEQELREMRQDATIFFYGVGGVFLAWTGMKVIGYVASVFG